MQAQNIVGTIGATKHTPTVGSIDKSFLKRMKKSMANPIGVKVHSFRSLRFMSNGQTK